MCATTAWASTCNMPTSCSVYSSACIAWKSSREPASAWPACAGSSSATMAGSGLKASLNRALPSISRYQNCPTHLLPLEDTCEAETDTYRGRQPPRSGTDTDCTGAQPAGERSGHHARWRRSTELPAAHRQTCKPRRRQSCRAAAGPQIAEGGRPGSPEDRARYARVAQYSSGYADLVAGRARPAQSLRAGGERLRGQAGRIQGFCRRYFWTRHLLGGGSRATTR